MAEDDNSPEGGGDLDPKQQMQKVLESRWDPAKISKFMRGGSGGQARRLDLSQRSRFEGRLGVSLGDVRVFSGELAEEITRAHNAEALTVADTGMILMRQSAAFSPGSSTGTALLAHELTHVAQAKPSAISRKKVDADLAEEDASEEEAEQHEAEVLAEEAGMPGAASSQADKDENDREKKEKIREKVLEIWREHDWIHRVRTGIGRDPDWNR